MSSQVFYRKWRPQTLAEVVGQEQVTQTLLNALASERVSHAYLFCGPRGTGKTSTGRILAKAVNCLNNEGKGEPCNTCTLCQATIEGGALDVIEIDAASNRRIDEIRDLREKVNYAPNQSRYKVYIIDEVHMLTNEASNALLKTLEEPPPHVIFILATTETHKVLPTIQSRCQRFDFRRIPQADVASKLSNICNTEGINIEPEAAKLIARSATGSLRDAENLLQQLTTYYGTEINFQQVQTILGITGDWRTKELVKQIMISDVASAISTINNVNSDGLDLRQFNRELVGHLRALLLVKTGSEKSVDLTADDLKELKDLTATASLPQILKAVKLFGQLELSFDGYSTLPMELAVVDCTLPSVEEKPVTDKQMEREERARITPAPETAAPPEKPVARTEPASEPIVPKPAVKPEPVAVSEVEPVPAVNAPPAVSEAGDEVARMKLNWRRFIQEAPGGIGRTPAAALLRSAIPKSVEDNVVVISFKFPLHKDNMEKLENQKIAEQIISSFLGRSCQVRCVYEPEDNHLVRAAQKIGAQIIDVEEK